MQPTALGLPKAKQVQSGGEVVSGCWLGIPVSVPANVDVALLFQLFFFRGCGLHGYLLPPVPSSHGLLLPGDLVVGIHSFL